MGDMQIKVTIPVDDHGMLGRECLECKKYFKVKPGTGLPINHCHCPYCEYEGPANTFWTPAQLEYAKSIALNEGFKNIVKPALDIIDKSFKDLERSSRNSMFQLKVTRTGGYNSFPVKHYSESELETNLTCDDCGLEFSVFGVFARCPDCNNLNAFTIYQKSLEVLKKQLEMLSKPGVEHSIQENNLNHILSACVSVFDGLGKELRNRRPELFPGKPKNLFQNLRVLDEKLAGLVSKSHSHYENIDLLFQVRHLYEHNMGVIDEDFIKQLPNFYQLRGRKYVLKEVDVIQFIEDMVELGVIIRVYFTQQHN